MPAQTTIGFDMGATTTKTGVVRDGEIILRGNVIHTRQDGNTAALIEFWEKLEVVPATLHNDAGIIGPATLAIESEFRHSA
jgi:activator of 2-hydroxyglutaryl-CoA dehydratase